MNDHTQDPLYQWCTSKLKKLKAEYDRTNRRDPRRITLRDQIDQLVIQRAKLRAISPSHTNYGLF